MRALVPKNCRNLFRRVKAFFIRRHLLRSFSRISPTSIVLNKSQASVGAKGDRLVFAETTRQKVQFFVY